MKNSYELSVGDSNPDLEISPSYFRGKFHHETGVQKRGVHGWIALALVLVLVIIFVILAILSGVLFRHSSTLAGELSELKYNVSTSQKDSSTLWKSVDNIMGDLSKIKTKVDTMGGSCTSCPKGWKLIRSYCYYFQSQTETWERSREKCAAHNGVLLILQDMFEMNSLLPTIGKGRYWIGLRRDSEDNDMWVWADGSSLIFSAWNDGEPNNDYNEEHCAEILGGVQAWNDRNCEHKIAYICKGVWTC